MRDIKCRIQYVSATGVGCLINIWEEGYEGGAADKTKTGADVPFALEQGVGSLQGGAVPLEYEESRTDDLLELVRYKTGYLSVIEEHYGDLDWLFTSDVRVHYIEFYYGSKLEFCGYIQCATYDRDWVSGPTELKIPVVSPLGLTEGLFFSARQPQEVTLGALLKEVIDGIGAPYTDVVFPEREPLDSYPDLRGTLNSLVVSPFNTDYNALDYTTEQEAEAALYAPVSYYDLLHGICAAYGWMVHELPDRLYFVQFDWDGNYSGYAVSDLSTMAFRMQLGRSTYDFDDKFEIAGDDHTLNDVVPKSRVELEMDGDFDKDNDVTLSHFIIYPTTDPAVPYDVIPYPTRVLLLLWLVSVDDYTLHGLADRNSVSGSGLANVASTLTYVKQYTSDEGANYDTEWVQGVLCNRDNTEADYEMFRFSFQGSGPLAYHPTLALEDFYMNNVYVTLNARATSDFRSRFKELEVRTAIGIRVKVGDDWWGAGSGTFFYKSLDQVEPSIRKVEMYAQDSYVTLRLAEVPQNTRVMVIVYQLQGETQGYSQGKMLLFTRFHYKFDKNYSAVWPEDLNPDLLNTKVLKSANGSRETSSVDLFINAYNGNSHSIGNKRLPLMSDYRYVLDGSRLLKVTCRLRSWPRNCYMDLCEIDGVLWRLVGYDFETKNEFFTLYFQRKL